MAKDIALHRIAVVLLTAVLLATLTVALTGGDRADAVDGPVETVYVATGRNFPDALAGATLATAAGAPMLTVEPRLPLPEATIAALEALDPNTIIVFGGPGAVPPDVFEALTAYARSGAVTRIAGTDRHDTAARIADALPDLVHDADLLDGLDSTDFLRANGTATDSQLLDGLDSTDFLRANGTATDSQLLDGLDSTDFLQQGQAAALPTSQTRWFSCTARAMTPDDADTDYDRVGHYVQINTTSQSLSCPLNLPDGAQLTTLSALVRDVSSDTQGGVICGVRITALDDSTGLTLGNNYSVATVSSLFTRNDNPFYINQGGLDDIIDNHAAAYRLGCEVNTTGGVTTTADLGIYGVRLAYVVDAVPGTNG